MPTNVFNTGHGHVRGRPDGFIARCGGPALCPTCKDELAQWGDDGPTYTPPLKLKKIHPKAIVPTYGSLGAACFDLYSVDTIQIGPRRAGTVSTGWMVELPPGWQMKIYSRSGQGFLSDVRLANCVGVCDPDYRGLIRVRLTNDSDKQYVVEAGDRVAQAQLEPVVRTEFLEVNELSITDRGEQGYGSTGR